MLTSLQVSNSYSLSKIIIKFNVSNKQIRHPYSYNINSILEDLNKLTSAPCSEKTFQTLFHGGSQPIHFRSLAVIKLRVGRRRGRFRRLQGASSDFATSYSRNNKPNTNKPPFIHKKTHPMPRLENKNKTPTRSIQLRSVSILFRFYFYSAGKGAISFWRSGGEG